MIKWPKQSECLALFGNPTDAGWENANVSTIVPPWPIYMDDIPIRRLKINKIAAESLGRVIKAIWDRCDHSTEKVSAAHCDCFSGDWNIRPIKGGSIPSMHTYALALDFDAGHNKLAAPENKTFFKPDSLIVQAFKSEGWVWGGDWKGRRDAMHFQAAVVG